MLVNMLNKLRINEAIAINEQSHPHHSTTLVHSHPPLGQASLQEEVLDPDHSKRHSVKRIQ